MKSIKFTVPGNPFGKQRPKFARMGTYTKTYTPKKTTQHEKEVAECFLEVARGRRFKEKEPLDIRIIAYYPIPQSTSKKRRKEMLEHRIRPTYNNAAYSVLGNAQELETANTFKVALTMSQVVVEDDAFIQELVEAMESQTMPVWDFQGVLKGRNGTEERMVYRECIPSGQVDLQNITVGDVIKRAWNFAVNRPPKLQNLLALG